MLMCEMIRAGGWTLLVGLFLAGNIWSEGFNVDQLVAQALAGNAELKFYEAEVAAAKGQRTQAGLWKNPEISGEYGERRTYHLDDGLNEDGFTRSASITQTFEFPGKGSLRKAIANKNIEIAELGLAQFRLVLAGQVRNLACETIAATANADAAEEIAERSAALVRLLRERPLAGSQQLLELRVIEGSLVDLQKSAKEFTRVREEARIELNRLLGYPVSHPLKLQVVLPLPNQKLEANALIMAGLKNNLQLKTRIAELEKSVRELSAARLEPAPDFNIGPFFSRDQAGGAEENRGASISLTLPLWDWNQGNVATAKARKEQADALLLEARRKVEAEIARRVRFYELARRQIDRLPPRLTNDLREASDLADRQYRTGSIPVQLYLEVQREFLSVQQIRHEALLEAWREIFDLELMVGGDLETGLASGMNQGESP